MPKLHKMRLRPCFPEFTVVFSQTLQPNSVIKEDEGDWM